jgi:hypothetical protein
MINAVIRARARIVAAPAVRIHTRSLTAVNSPSPVYCGQKQTARKPIGYLGRYELQSLCPRAVFRSLSNFADVPGINRDVDKMVLIYTCKVRAVDHNSNLTNLYRSAILGVQRKYQSTAIIKDALLFVVLDVRTCIVRKTVVTFHNI